VTGNSPEVQRLIDLMRREMTMRPHCGAEYAIAAGTIGGIMNPGSGRYAHATRQQRLDAIADVLLALDMATDSGMGAAVPPAGVQRSPERDGGGYDAAVPARSAVVSSPTLEGGGPGTDLTPHGRTCLCTDCLPDRFAMGTADYASAKRVMWA
jgi:hypothetical protein